MIGTHEFVVTQPDSSLDYIGEWEQVRIVSYAAIEAMLVHALRHEPGALAALLHAIEAKYDRLDNPYVEAGQRLWQTYRATQDPLAACEAMERTVREQLDRARFFHTMATTWNDCPYSASVLWMTPGNRSSR